MYILSMTCILLIKHIGLGVRSAKYGVEIHSQPVPRIAKNRWGKWLQSFCDVRLNDLSLPAFSAKT